MSLFDYSAAKEFLRKAGHLVSEGEQMFASDLKELVKLARNKFGLPEHLTLRGIANVDLLPKDFPGVSTAPVAEDAKEEATAPVAEEVSKEEAPAPVKVEVTEVKESAPEVAAQEAKPEEAVQQDEQAAADATATKKKKKADAADSSEQAAQ